MLVLGSLKEFFEGLYPLFWVEVLSIMGTVPIGVPSPRGLLSWVRVSTLLPFAKKLAWGLCAPPSLPVLTLRKLGVNFFLCT